LFQTTGEAATAIEVETGILSGTMKMAVGTRIGITITWIKDEDGINQSDSVDRPILGHNM